MNEAYVRRLYRYTDWANERMLEVIEALDDEQRERAVPSSFPSIRDTLAHIAFAEWLWLQRWLGDSPTERVAWTNSTSLADLREGMRRVADERRTFLGTLSDDSVSRRFAYRSMKGDPFEAALGDALVHCANHSTYHRGQLVTMLRQVGVKPPGTDFIEFTRHSE